MKSGLKQTKPDRRDFDLIKTRIHKLSGVTTLTDTYCVRNKQQRIPNQQAEDTHFTPPVPPLPLGCTDYGQATVCSYEDGELKNPLDLENITHANANGGTDMRTSLKAVTKVWSNHPAYFRVLPQLGIDAFDTVRLAMLATSNEKRAVSVGSPFWLQWGAVGPNGILPPPDYDLHYATWHNWVIDGWDTLNNVTYLTCQMLQGTSYGNHGTAYITREQFNATMAVPGAMMFTIDRIMPGEQVQTVSLPFIQAIGSFLRNLFS